MRYALTTCSDTNISSGVTTEHAESTHAEREVPRLVETERYIRT